MHHQPIRTTNVRTRFLWGQHAAEWSQCQACNLCEHARNHVLGRGQLPCQILFIGEAPGKTEDIDGVPFCGPSGKLLDQLIAAYHHDYNSRFTYAITNTVACIPYLDPTISDNPSDWSIRAPAYTELKACSSRLVEFINLANPKAVILLGQTAITACKAINFPNALVPYRLYHPAYILRRGGRNSKAFTDWYKKFSTIITGVLK
jgi:uracil-DNA glycosylase family 4